MVVYFLFVCVRQKFHPQCKLSDLETDNPRQAVFHRDKCYETMLGGTQPQVPKMFLNQANTTLLQIKF